jgi:YbgC/YbaW family acyl-CoA thioester hydrolase
LKKFISFGFPCLSVHALNLDRKTTGPPIKINQNPLLLLSVRTNLREYDQRLHREELMTTHLKNISKTREFVRQDRTKRNFVFRKRVYLSDTNMQGNVYFARIFEWQGETREEYLRVAVPDHEHLFKAGLRLLTVEAAAEYKGEAKLYDEIEILMSVPWIKRASFQLSFDITNARTGQSLAVGKQLITCANSEGKLIAIPHSIRNALLPLCQAA